MSLTPEQTTALLRRRRAIFPKTYVDQPIEKAIIEEVLENANWAPTHKFTEPWRFRVFTGEARTRLGEHLAALYKANTPEAQFSEKKYEKNLHKPQRSGCIIAICMQRDPEERVPEWEEIAAVACAVQNMWLTCTAHGIGSYWSSANTLQRDPGLLNLQEGERCLGLFYMGYHNLPELPGKRGPIEEKVTWM
ncbi:MAG: nitroreductase [Phaeodactylibacter sp.]|uniref:nitroreductase family protein n=1 Tax=Phaeodactylibacter sp. TaxID=1940289 RepID=UPI0032ED7182